ncbi:hypothetical protein [Nocardia nova]|nr:hypothetical protein [Nocardia nova]
MADTVGEHPTLAFRPGLSRCVGAAINGYFADGLLPAADVACAPDTGVDP